jgi:long-chain fatty acid transport protein
MLRIRFCAAAPVLVLAIGSLAFAPVANASEGNQLLGIGPIQESLAGAGVAAAEDATWSLLNPASLVDVESRFDAYLMFLFLTRTLEPKGIGLASNKFAGEMVDTRPLFFPSFAVAIRRDYGTFAFGMLGAEGDEVDFEKSRSTLGRWKNDDRRSSLETAIIPLAFAHKFDNGWAVGGALLLEYSRLRTDSLTLRLLPTRGDYEWDDAFGAGFQFGVYKQWERWGFGASYRTQQKLNRFDRYKDLTKFSIDLPPQFQIGLAYRPTRRIELLADYRYIGWNQVNQFGEPTIPKGGLNWDDQHIGKLAVIGRLSDRWTLRGGLSYGKAPIDKKVIFENGHFPAVAEMHVTAGFTYRLNDRTELHFSYDHAFHKEMKDSGTGDLFSFAGRGTRIGMEQDFIALGYTRRF